MERIILSLNPHHPGKLVQILLRQLNLFYISYNYTDINFFCRYGQFTMQVLL